MTKVKEDKSRYFAYRMKSNTYMQRFWNVVQRKMMNMKLGLGKWNLCYFLTIKSSHITTKAIFRDFIEQFWSWVARDEGCLEIGKSGGVEKKYRASYTTVTSLKRTSRSWQQLSVKNQILFFRDFIRWEFFQRWNFGTLSGKRWRLNKVAKSACVEKRFRVSYNSNMPEKKKMQQVEVDNKFQSIWRLQSQQVRRKFRVFVQQ